MTPTLLRLVARYGLLAIFITMAGESCGLPLPSEVVVPAGGAFVAGALPGLLAVTLVATLANVVGSLVAYFVALRWGRPVLLGPGRYVGIRRHHVNLAQRWFDRYGLWAVFFGRLLPVIRTYISFPAGLARVPLVPFIVLTAVGAVPWNLALAYLGFTLRSHFDTVARFIADGGYVFAVLVAAAVVAWWWLGRRGESEDTG